MNVTEAVTSRRSIRQFIDKPVDRDILQKVLETAQRSPSGGNLQPWNTAVLTGAPLQTLIQTVAPHVARGRAGMTPEYPIYPEKLDGRYKQASFDIGEKMYQSLNIARDDKAGRVRQMRANFHAFDAPVVMFVHTPRYMGPPQWSDIGMWLQTVMLLLREAGLDSCAQEAWSTFGEPVRAALKIPDDHIFFCGLAIGYRDPDAPINRFAVPRNDLREVIEWSGF